VWLLLASLHLNGNLLPCTPPGPLHVEAKVKVIASPAAVVVRSYNAGARRVHGTHHTRHGPTCMFFIFFKRDRAGSVLTADTGHMRKRDQPTETVCNQPKVLA